tara:strand:+ start:144 stop:590 length:447 start_codon:yes stop_codon:yes gene_type:complete
MGTPYKMKGSPMARNFGVGTESPLKSGGLVKIAVKGAKKVYDTAKKIYKSTKGTPKTEPTYFNKSTGRYQSTKPKTKAKSNTKTSTTRTNADGKSTTTVNKTNGKTTSEATRTSWPSVKPGSKSMHSGTTTNAGGKVTAWDPTKRQIL